MTQPIALLVHNNETTLQRYQMALGCPVRWVQSRGSQFSAGYDGLGNDNDIVLQAPTLDKAVAKWAPEAGPGAPVVLVCFSAGCWAGAAWLRDPDARLRCIAAVFIDGLHSKSTAFLGGILDFARMALAGKRTLVISHSAIIPYRKDSVTGKHIRYTSTTETGDFILSQLGHTRPKPTVDFDHARLHIRAYPGGDAKAHQDQIGRFGPQLCGDLVAPVVRDARDANAPTDPVMPAVRGDVPLRERALAVCLAEAKRWGSQPVPASRVAEYLRGCERNGQGIGDWLVRQHLSGTSMSFCAAAQGWAERQAAAQGDQLPPWRAGARETERDAKAGRRGRWLPRENVLAGELPPAGALAVYTRGDPAKGLGHVERVIEATADGYRSVGANEVGGRWVIDTAQLPYTHARLLGFVVDGGETQLMRSDPPNPQPSDFVEPDLSDDDVRELRLFPLEVPWGDLIADRDAAVREDG